MLSLLPGFMAPPLGLAPWAHGQRATGGDGHAEGDDLEGREWELGVQQQNLGKKNYGNNME